MSYKFIQIKVYNDDPDEDNSWHVECRIDDQKEWKFDDLMERVIKPAMNCIFSKMIPDMPRVTDRDALAQLEAWSQRYYG